MVSRSCPDSAVPKPPQLPASSLTSPTCFPPASPASGTITNTAASSRAPCFLIADLLRSSRRFVPFVEVPGIDVGSVPDGRGERAGIAFDGFIEKRQAVRIAPIDPALG